MKIHFTLDAWLKDKNQKIVTESDLPVEIIHIEDDCADELPIIAMIGDKPRRIVQAYSTDGEPENEIIDLYLFLVTPEPEMSEFEKRLQEVLFEHATTNSSAEEKAHQYSAELLSFAKQQLLQSGELLTQEHHEKLMDTLYKETLEGVKKNWHDYFTPQAVTDIYNAGRNDVLKDLPRWKKCNLNTFYNTKCNFVVNGIGRYLILDGYMIDVDRLEKLPGFKEDK